MDVQGNYEYKHESVSQTVNVNVDI